MAPTEKITYGPHRFISRPEENIRHVDSYAFIGIAHENIRSTLFAAFDDQNPDSVMHQLPERFNHSTDVPVQLVFINYGGTQLVFIAVIENRRKVAVLINQPQTPIEIMEEEFKNLQRLHKMDHRFVVEPYTYFADENHALHVCQYIENAMCVTNCTNVNNVAGAYDPIPHYHFEPFSTEVINAANSSMIALLVNYYDAKNGKGLAKTQVSGNDFILTRDFKKDDPDTVLPNMKLIAARGLIEEPLEEYLERLRREFAIGTQRTDPDVVGGRIKVNHRSKVPMTKNQIEDGIELGLDLRKER